MSVATEDIDKDLGVTGDGVSFGIWDSSDETSDLPDGDSRPLFSDVSSSVQNSANLGVSVSADVVISVVDLGSFEIVLVVGACVEKFDF